MEYEQNLCRDLQDLLSGNIGIEYFSDVEELREHWETCAKCRATFPDADARVKHIEQSLLGQIQGNIVLLHEQYCLEKKRIIEKDAIRSAKEREEFEKALTYTEDGVIVFDPSPAVSESEDTSRVLQTQFLALLDEKGKTIRGQLQVMNDNWGLDVFRLASPDGYCEYSSRFCGPLIASLSREIQLFVFQAILAADLRSLFEEEVPSRFAFPIYGTVERAAPECLRLYFDDQKNLLSAQKVLSPTNGPDASEVSLKLERIEQLAEDVIDGLDSLKAGQMEIRLGQKKRAFQAAMSSAADSPAHR